MWLHITNLNTELKGLINNVIKKIIIYVYLLERN